MEIIKAGCTSEENGMLVVAGSCTQEPGDNCWLHLD